MRKVSWCALCVAVGLGGCSTVVEDKPTAGIDMKRFAVGERRIDILKSLGVPATSTRDGPNSCDIYRYAHTVNRAGQAGLDVVDTAGNFFTFGLFGVVTSPAREAMDGKVQTVFFCYSGDELLVSVVDQGRKLTPDQQVAQTPRPVAASAPQSIPGKATSAAVP